MSKAKVFKCFSSISNQFTNGKKYVFSYSGGTYTCTSNDNGEHHVMSERCLDEHFILWETEPRGINDTKIDLEGYVTLPYSVDNEEPTKPEPKNHMQEILVHLTDKLQSTLLKKNQDYGNSYEKTYNKHGNSAIRIRLEDKLARLDELLDPKTTQQVSDESIDDTLLDLAGYAILALAVRSKE